MRLADNPALHACAQSKLPVLPVFICDEDSSCGYGSAAKVWLNGSLEVLDASLQKLGSRLILLKGKPGNLLPELAEKFNATIHANTRYEPQATQAQTDLQHALRKKGVTLELHTQGHLLFEPNEVRTGQGKPYQVFTPFYKNCRHQWKDFTPLPTPTKLAALAKGPASEKLATLKLLPQIKWDSEIKNTWTPGEEQAQKFLKEFASGKIADYPKARDWPSIDGTTSLSPYLAFGEISPRLILKGLQKCQPAHAETFVRELIWREFAYHVLVNFPHTVERPLREKFAHLEWNQDPKAFARWSKGLTGYPIVDAGMRQLWHTGWMHNRVRMIVGSFLTKDLLISWKEGAAWFWDTLVDADLANNTLNWQWVGGCGADAQPFFRIFNPETQSKKFDPKGAYIRKWLPELSKLPDKYLHAPWNTPEEILKAAGITLGQTYPEPIVDHAEARQDALAAYGRIKAR